MRAWVEVGVINEGPRVDVEVEPRSTFAFARGFSCIASVLICARGAGWGLRPYAREGCATVEIHLIGLFEVVESWFQRKHYLD